ncbi:MAG: hypothetical protein AAGC81_15490 [Pseudomonadota bacterium]
MADAYDFWADRISPEETSAIDQFWERFLQIEGELDKAFSGGDTEIDPADATIEAMGNLDQMGIFWEYGPSERGHHLAISPELNHQARPLARALLKKAPDLPRWLFYDARPPSSLDENTVGLISGRASMEFPLTGIRATAGQHQRVDFTGIGRGDEETLGGFAGLTFSVLFGEAVERDWLGEIAGEPKGMLGSVLSRTPDAQTWLPGFMEETEAVLQSLKDARPARSLTAPLTQESEYSLLELTPDREEPDIGTDLVSYITPYPALCQAMLQGARVSMPRYSRFDESFCGICIARTEAHAFDKVAERADLAEKVNEMLQSAGIGAVVGEGHGLLHVYIDLVVTDISKAIGIAERVLGQAGIKGPARFRFHEAGLEERSIPLTLTNRPN